VWVWDWLENEIGPITHDFCPKNEDEKRGALCCAYVYANGSGGGGPGFYFFLFLAFFFNMWKNYSIFGIF
jgi:hypothetical protein